MIVSISAKPIRPGQHHGTPAGQGGIRGGGGSVPAQNGPMPVVRPDSGI